MAVSPPIFEIQDLTITYGSQRAVEALSLQHRSGTSLGLLGANGAGKTSTIRAILGMCKPRRGRVEIFGEPPGRPRVFRRIGFAPEEGAPPEFLSGREFLGFVAGFRIRDLTRRERDIQELLDWFELAPQKKIRDYSKGMKRRLLLAQAFLGDPELLILDEPLSGLDPLIIIKLRQKLDEYRKRGGTILFSSHILAEVEKSCTDVAILSEGRLICHSPVEELTREYGSVEAAFAAKVKKG